LAAFRRPTDAIFLATDFTALVSRPAGLRVAFFAIGLDLLMSPVFVAIDFELLAAKAFVICEL
jgi:hypothetical protein